ncbi:pilus assembly FimT family protein [Thiohalorhabdus sp. Cl-TMA]|uniref:Tfp pilus assembly protein FimT/FimU n=1 Tax=Thiohalorhabdus methylotrophus TaxID=3242694 RepID=A0ABV4TYA6_9GAMM
MRDRGAFPSPRGYTVIELVTVIVILGVLAAVGLPRFFDSGDYAARAGVDQTLGALRFAQQQAMSRLRRIRVETAGQSVRLEYCDTALTRGTTCGGAGGSWRPVRLPQRAANRWTIGVPITSATFHFNSLGRLVDSAGSPRDDDPDLTVGSGRIVRLVGETGFAYAP